MSQLRAKCSVPKLRPTTPTKRSIRVQNEEDLQSRWSKWSSSPKSLSICTQQFHLHVATFSISPISRVRQRSPSLHDSTQKRSSWQVCVEARASKSMPNCKLFPRDWSRCAIFQAACGYPRHPWHRKRGEADQSGQPKRSKSIPKLPKRERIWREEEKILDVVKGFLPKKKELPERRRQRRDTQPLRKKGSKWSRPFNEKGKKK